MKILFSASVYSHFRNFHMPYMQELIKQGHDVYAIGYNDGAMKDILDLGVHCVNIKIDRNPFKMKNLLGIKALNSFLRNNKFDLITTHTPFISFCIRIINNMNNKNPIIYTAHGFHFYRGAPLINSLLYKNMEKIAARYTNKIIVMNKEDYNNALKFYKNNNVKYVNGIGVNLEKYNSKNSNNKNIKKELNLSKKSFLIVYIAELSERKNQQFLLNNWKEIKSRNPYATLLMIGDGPNEKKYRQYIQNENLEDVFLLGFRSDVNEIVAVSDLVVLLSKQEGLPRCILEGMALGKAILVSNIRGNVDLISDSYNGYIVSLEDNKKLIEKIESLSKDATTRLKMGNRNLNEITKYSEANVMKEMLEIYKEYVVINN